MDIAQAQGYLLSATAGFHYITSSSCIAIASANVSDNRAKSILSLVSLAFICLSFLYEFCRSKVGQPDTGPYARSQMNRSYRNIPTFAKLQRLAYKAMIGLLCFTSIVSVVMLFKMYFSFLFVLLICGINLYMLKYYNQWEYVKFPLDHFKILGFATFASLFVHSA